MKNQKNSLWTEKYRPTSIDSFNGPDHLKRFLKNTKNGEHPHLLLYGPPGTGKTTFASLLGPTFSLNASDERGIATIRNKIKELAATARKEVIVLDECENLSKDSQTCLRRILEDYPTTRFIFCTNYSSRIIEPLKSRLLKLKFTVGGMEILERIGREEGMEYGRAFYEEVLRKSEGDLRKSINILQSIKYIRKNVESNIKSEDLTNANKDLTNTCDVDLTNTNNVDPININEIIGNVPDNLISQFREINVKTYRKFIQTFLEESYSALQLIKQLGSTLQGTDLQKAKFSMALGASGGHCVSGVMDELVLYNLCIKKIEIYN